MGAEAEDLYTDHPADSTQGWRTQAFAYNAKSCAGVIILRMGALFSFRCCYCEKTVRLSAKQWSNAYRTLLDHVADCGREAGAGYDEMREYISAVMSDWPARPAPARD